MGNRGKEKIGSPPLFPIIYDKLSFYQGNVSQMKKPGFVSETIPFHYRGTAPSAMAGYNPWGSGHRLVHWTRPWLCPTAILLIIISGLISHGKGTAYCTSSIFLSSEVPWISVSHVYKFKKWSSYLEQVKNSDRNQIAPKASPLFPREPIQNHYLRQFPELGPVLLHVYWVMDFPPFPLGQYFWIQFSPVRTFFYPHSIKTLSSPHVSAFHPITRGSGLSARVNNHNLLRLLFVILPRLPFVVHFILCFHGWWLYFTSVVTQAHQSPYLHISQIYKRCLKF